MNRFLALMGGLTLMTCSLACAQDVDWEVEPERPDSLFEWRVGDPNWQPPAEERVRMITDRPHVSEATALVGLGRVQLETGYTYFLDSQAGTVTQTHSFPEPLLRIGMFAEWFELRLGYNYLI